VFTYGGLIRAAETDWYCDASFPGLWGARVWPSVLLAVMIAPCAASSDPLSMTLERFHAVDSPPDRYLEAVLVPVFDLGTGRPERDVAVLVEAREGGAGWALRYSIVRYRPESGPSVVPVSGELSGFYLHVVPVEAFHDESADALRVVTYHTMGVGSGDNLLIAEITGFSTDAPALSGHRTARIVHPNDVDDKLPVVPRVVDGRPCLVYVEPVEPFDPFGYRRYRLVRLDLDSLDRTVLATFGVGEPGWRVNLGDAGGYYVVSGPGWAVAVRKSDRSVIPVTPPEGWRVRFSENRFVSGPTAGPYVILDSEDGSATALGALNADGSVSVVLDLGGYWEGVGFGFGRYGLHEAFRWIATHSVGRGELALGLEAEDGVAVTRTFPFAVGSCALGYWTFWVGPFVLTGPRESGVHRYVLYLVKIPAEVSVDRVDRIVTLMPASWCTNGVVVPELGVREVVKTGSPDQPTYEVIPEDQARRVKVVYRYLGPFFVAEREVQRWIGSPVTVVPVVPVPVRRRRD